MLLTRLSFASVLAAGVLISAVGGTPVIAANGPAPQDTEVKKDGGNSDKPAAETYPIVTMETSRGTIRIRLYPEEAPKTVANFIKLANKGYYDGLRFHRVEPGFVIQGGDPKGDGSGGPGYTIPDEKNKKLKHVVGAVAMAKTPAPNSAGSQFYIVIGKPAPALDGKYTVFGQVIDGQSAAARMRRNDQMFKVSVVEPASPSTESKPTPEETPKKG
ncbi:MAG: peptidylprolyl isomerase [Armatimonadota bacterium]